MPVFHSITEPSSYRPSFRLTDVPIISSIQWLRIYMSTIGNLDTCLLLERMHEESEIGKLRTGAPGASK